jgi:hypothetical protein
VNENLLRKITPWLPVLIVAGYFIFLVATWQRYILTNREIMKHLEARDDSIDGSNTE